MNIVSKRNFLSCFSWHRRPLREPFPVLTFRFGKITFSISSAEVSHWSGEAAFEVKPGRAWTDWLGWNGKVSISDIWIIINELSEASDSILPIFNILHSVVIGQSVLAMLLEHFFGAAVSDHDINDDLGIIRDLFSASLNASSQIGAPDDSTVDEEPIVVLTGREEAWKRS
jgi:hypothetical protein